MTASISIIEPNTPARAAGLLASVRMYGFLFLVMPMTMLFTIPGRRHLFVGTNVAVALSLLLATLFTALYRLAEAVAQRMAGFDSAPWEPLL